MTRAANALGAFLLMRQGAGGGANFFELAFALWLLIKGVQA